MDWPTDRSADDHLIKVVRRNTQPTAMEASPWQGRNQAEPSKKAVHAVIVSAPLLCLPYSDGQDQDFKAINLSLLSSFPSGYLLL